MKKFVFRIDGSTAQDNMATMRITTDTKFDTVSIKINDITYLSFLRTEYIGFHSWFQGENKFLIELYFKTTSILTEQDSFDKWKQIIETLDNLNL